VAFWNADRGFGFITPDSGGENTFAHIKQVSPDFEFDDLPKGTRVSYEIGESKKPGKVEAKNVRIIEGTK
jgi:CspA family cold shock protein